MMTLEGNVTEEKFTLFLRGMTKFVELLALYEEPEKIIYDVVPKYMPYSEALVPP